MTLTTQDISMREKLAKERTFLALDRTMMAYIRTAMTIAIVGISLFKFFENSIVQYAGSAVIGIACLFLLRGLSNVLNQRKKVEHIHLVAVKK